MSLWRKEAKSHIFVRSKEFLILRFVFLKMILLLMLERVQFSPRRVRWKSGLLFFFSESVIFSNQVEMDAMVMEGEVLSLFYIKTKKWQHLCWYPPQDLEVGSIACVSNVKNPILLARCKLFAKLDDFCQFDFNGNHLSNLTRIKIWWLKASFRENAAHNDGRGRCRKAGLWRPALADGDHHHHRRPFHQSTQAGRADLVTKEGEEEWERWEV